MKLKTLDLFSGIGGFALALQDFTTPIGYCDIDPVCQNILKTCIHKKRIKKAPIYADVSALAQQSHKICADEIDLVVGGFPCQDISVMNHTTIGIHGSRSKLFFDALHLAHAKNASFLFFENSPNLLNRGLADIEHALIQFGYPNFVYGVFSASHVGAPHVRKRFFLLATQADKTKLCVVYRKLAKYQYTHDDNIYWKKHPFPPQHRLIPNTRQTFLDLRKRGMVLGNAIVPQCARYAFLFLMHKMAIENAHGLVHHQNAGVSDTYLFRMIIPAEKFTPSLDVKTPIFYKKSWSTPLRNEWITSCTNVSSSRATRILPNQILYDPQSWYQKKKGVGMFSDWIVNPNFVEWLMGFPEDWTK